MSLTHRDKSAAGRGRRYKLQVQESFKKKKQESSTPSQLHILAALSINHIGEVAPRCVSLGRPVVSVIPLPIKRRRGWGAAAMAAVGVTPPACVSFLKWGSSRGAEKGGRMVLS